MNKVNGLSHYKPCTHHMRVQYSKRNGSTSWVLIVQIFANTVNVGILLHLLRWEQTKVHMASVNKRNYKKIEVYNTSTTSIKVL